MSYTDALRETAKELNEINLRLVSIDGHLEQVNGNVARHETTLTEHSKLLGELSKSDAVAKSERSQAAKDRDSIKGGLERTWDALGKPAVAAVIVYILTQVLN